MEPTDFPDRTLWDAAKHGMLQSMGCCKARPHCTRLKRLFCGRRKRRQFVNIARVVLDHQRGPESRHDPLQPLD